jgi:hypothetical protein
MEIRMTFRKWVIAAECCIVVCSAGAIAQTTVTTSGGTTNAVPLFTGTSAVGNSVITQSSGNVGIGEPNPAFPLDVTGVIRSYNNQNSPGTQPAVIVGSDNLHGIGVWEPGGAISGVSTVLQSGSAGSIAYTPNGGTSYPFFVNDTGSAYVQGPLGIGTTTPTDVLTILGGGVQLESESSSSVTSGIGLGPDTNNSIFNFSYTNSQGTYLMRHYGLTILPNSSPETYLAGYGGLGLVTGGINRFWINGSGSVGIGTTTPSQKLEVAGYIQADSGIYFPGNATPQTVPWTGVVCGGDYAESVNVTGDRTNYEPGDVLVVDPDHPGKFLKSAEPYSTAVTGVYSTRPGVVGRRQSTPASPDEVPMAMIGIVPTKVSAENGSIRPGDLLVTSSTVGYAMRGTDRSQMLGAVIGKALGSLDSGTGVIEVAVTLQ